MNNDHYGIVDKINKKILKDDCLFYRTFNFEDIKIFNGIDEANSYILEDLKDIEQNLVVVSLKYLKENIEVN